jgi:hypothetical protein
VCRFGDRSRPGPSEPPAARLFSGTGPRWYAATSLALGLAALLALALLFATGLRVPAPGIAQKAMQFSADIWVFVLAVALLRARGTGA